ncbi:uncharacterized protein LOC141601881 [Silene latifolia]|uniref:uncharacterized protein LOC141601881 n=1 Tax=Silene latifolia TaxID=37657 RepID=UPI003D7845F4
MGYIRCKGREKRSNVYKPPPDSNWNWRNICKVKERLSGGYQNGLWIHDAKGYSIRSGYDWLQGMHPPVQWYKDVWGGWIVPKHSMVGWLIKLEALNTREKLYRHGISDSDMCVLCEEDTESHAHLFTSCQFSTQILRELENWLHLQVQGPHGNYSKMQRKVCSMAWLAYCYVIWTERNNNRIELQVKRPSLVLKHLIQVIRGRIQNLLPPRVKSTDAQWLISLDIKC